MKTRREGKKQFNVLVDKDRCIALEQILLTKNITKKQWLEEKIDEEIKGTKK